MPDSQVHELETRLADLGLSISFPRTPAIAEVVIKRISREPRRRAWRRPLARGTALALAAVVLLVGIAVAAGIRLGGLRFVFGPATFSALPSQLAEPGLGRATTLQAVRQQIAFTLRVPSLARLGEPDFVYLAVPPMGGAVTMLYGDRPGFPAQPGTKTGLIISQFPADVRPEVFEKLIAPDVSMLATTVRGQPAWWVGGARHFFYYRDANGQIVTATMRLAGNTLTWVESDVTYRVEGAPSLAAAVEVAESLR